MRPAYCIERNPLRSSGIYSPSAATGEHLIRPTAARIRLNEVHPMMQGYRVQWPGGPAESSELHMHRMKGVLRQVAAIFPGIDIGPVGIGFANLPCAAITLPDGTHLVLSVDPDIPEALYELMRVLKVDAAVCTHPFEVRATAYAATDKLTSGQVIRLMAQYLRVHGDYRGEARESPRTGEIG